MSGNHCFGRVLYSPGFPVSESCAHFFCTHFRSLSQVHILQLITASHYPIPNSILSHSPLQQADDPLCQAPNSAWARMFSDQSLLSEIDKDTSRTHMDHAFFQTDEAAKTLKEILFVWCLENPSVG